MHGSQTYFGGGKGLLTSALHLQKWHVSSAGEMGCNVGAQGLQRGRSYLTKRAAKLTRLQHFSCMSSCGMPACSRAKAFLASRLCMFARAVLALEDATTKWALVSDNGMFEGVSYVVFLGNTRV